MVISAVNSLNSNVKFGDAGYTVVEYIPNDQYYANRQPSFNVVNNDEYCDSYNGMPFSQADYDENLHDLEDIRSSIYDITQSSSIKPLKKVGNIADVLITGALSGMALHWSTGKTVVMIDKLAKKPKVANFLQKFKAPFKSVGSAVKNGTKTFNDTIKNDLNKTTRGKKFYESKPIVAFREFINNSSKKAGELKTKIKGLTLEKVRNTVAGVFGVSGFVAGSVDKADAIRSKNAD